MRIYRYSGPLVTCVLLPLHNYINILMGVVVYLSPSPPTLLIVSLFSSSLARTTSSSSYPILRFDLFTFGAEGPAVGIDC